MWCIIGTNISSYIHGMYRMYVSSATLKTGLKATTPDQKGISAHFHTIAVSLPYVLTLNHHKPMVLYWGGPHCLSQDLFCRLLRAWCCMTGPLDSIGSACSIQIMLRSNLELQDSYNRNWKDLFCGCESDLHGFHVILSPCDQFNSLCSHITRGRNYLRGSGNHSPHKACLSTFPAHWSHWVNCSPCLKKTQKT